MSDLKDRIRKAMEAHCEKQLPKVKKTRKKKNDNPEGKFSIVFKKHLESLNWDIDIVESKGVYNESAGRYLHGKTASGFSDICGNMPNGHAVFIELKDKGKRSTVRPDQHEFLIRKISTNCFAAVVDSIEYFNLLFQKWTESENRKTLLLKEMPQLAPRYKKLDSFDL